MVHGHGLIATVRNPADDRLHTPYPSLEQHECNRPVSGLASLAASPSHVVRARPDGRHVTSQWPVNRRFTLMQPH